MRLRRRCSCDRQRVPRRRARVSGLCGFPSAAERVPAESHKTERCADVRGVAETANAEEASLQAASGRKQSRKRRGRRKGLALFCASPSTSARSAGSFGR